MSSPLLIKTRTGFQRCSLFEKRCSLFAVLFGSYLVMFFSNGTFLSSLLLDVRCSTYVLFAPCCVVVELTSRRVRRSVRSQFVRFVDVFASIVLFAVLFPSVSFNRKRMTPLSPTVLSLSGPPDVFVALFAVSLFGSLLCSLRLFCLRFCFLQGL